MMANDKRRSSLKMVPNIMRRCFVSFHFFSKTNGMIQRSLGGSSHIAFCSWSWPEKASLCLPPLKSHESLSDLRKLHHFKHDDLSLNTFWTVSFGLDVPVGKCSTRITQGASCSQTSTPKICARDLVSSKTRFALEVPSHWSRAILFRQLTRSSYPSIQFHINVNCFVSLSSEAGLIRTRTSWTEQAQIAYMRIWRILVLQELCPCQFVLHNTRNLEISTRTASLPYSLLLLLLL